jgi:iron complex outermembrane receptor protein
MTVGGLQDKCGFMSSVSGKALAIAGSVAMSLGTTMVASAQDSSDTNQAESARAIGGTMQVQDVVVSGGPPEGISERAIEAQKTPRPIVVIDRNTAVTQQLRTLDDFEQYLPNYTANISNPRTSRPAIRGVSQGAGTGDGSEFDTGFIQDNVFWKHVGFQWQNYYDLESVELALGPQGTKGGKNTTVGAVIIRTQRPTFERLAVSETTFGNLGHIYQEGIVNSPIIEDKLAARVSGYMESQDGWITDQQTGAGYSNINRWAIRAQGYFDSEGITNRFIFNTAQSNEYNNYNSGPFADSFLVYANGTRQVRSYSQTVAQRLGRPLLTLDPYKPYLVRTGVLDQRLYQVSNELTTKVGENTFQSISAFGFFRLNPINTTGNENISLSAGASDTWVEQYSQELRLSSPAGETVEWVAGLYAFYEKVWNRSNTVYGGDASVWFSQPALLDGNRNNRDGKAKDVQLAAYANATWHVDDKLALTGGIRESYEIKSGENRSWITWYPYGPYSFQQQASAIAAAGGASQSIYYTGLLTQPHSFITAIVNPQYAVNENILAYAIFGYGEKAGAVNTTAQPVAIGSNIFTDLITKPERSWDYEVGVKTNWFDQKLFLNVNLYWNDLYNFQTNQVEQVQTANGTTTTATFLGVAPHARLRGFEWDGRWSPVEKLWIIFSGAITEARWIDFANAPPPPDWAWPAANNINGVAAPATLSRSNTRWDYLPVWKFNLGATYDIPLGSAFAELGEWGKKPVTLFGYANLSWSDKYILTSPLSVQKYWQDPYTIVNLGLGLRTDDDQYSLSFWVKNLFDARYIPGTAGQATAPFAPGNPTTVATIGIQNFPRTLGGSFRMKFN